MKGCFTSSSIFLSAFVCAVSFAFLTIIACKQQKREHKEMVNCRLLHLTPPEFILSQITMLRVSNITIFLNPHYMYIMGFLPKFNSFIYVIE